MRNDHKYKNISYQELISVADGCPRLTRVISKSQRRYLRRYAKAKLRTLQNREERKEQKDEIR